VLESTAQELLLAKALKLLYFSVVAFFGDPGP
jgi:hypothetical protein